jgi:MerR family transcriptional regulator/heat shock protein HspR
MAAKTIISREQVAEHFAVASQLLVRYESRGLIHPVREGSVEGYDPAELRQIWSIVSLQRDLGINLAGVEAILKLRAHVNDLHRRIHDLAETLERLREDDDESGHLE